MKKISILILLVTMLLETTGCQNSANIQKNENFNSSKIVETTIEEQNKDIQETFKKKSN